MYNKWIERYGCLGVNLFYKDTLFLYDSYHMYIEKKIRGNAWLTKL